MRWCNMARGRFISNNLGESDKFAQLDDHGQRMLYMMLVTHADAEGRLKADTRWIRGKVLTYIDYSDEEIETAVARMHELGLIVAYSVDGKQYMEIVKFHEHNKIRRGSDKKPSHESHSVIPPLQSPEAVLAEPLRSGDVTARLEVEVKDKVEDKDKEQETTSSSGDDPIEVIVDDDPLDYQAIVDAYNENCGRLPKIMKLNSTRKSRLRTLVRDLGSLDEAIAVVSIAAREVGQNEFWIKKEYNLDNLLNGQKLIGKAEIAMQRGSFDHNQSEIDRMLEALGGTDA